MGAWMIMDKGWLSHSTRWVTAIGLVLLAVYAGGLIHRVVSSDHALRELDKAQAFEQVLVELRTQERVHFSLWSKNRFLADGESLLRRKGPPLAVLRFGELDLRVSVFEGTDELTLNRGAGWIEGTARPGAAGNSGIAGHRDGFFHRLRDVAQGDAIELATAVSTIIDTADEIDTVHPSDVGVLRPRAEPSLTLVTCYPFYVVGQAPPRFIVRAALGE